MAAAAMIASGVETALSPASFPGVSFGIAVSLLEGFNVRVGVANVQAKFYTLEMQVRGKMSVIAQTIEVVAGTCVSELRKWGAGHAVTGASWSRYWSW
jgi:hypothetical protein